MKTTNNTVTVLESRILKSVDSIKSYGMDCNIDRLEDEIYSLFKDMSTTKQLRGAMASLIRKDLLIVNEGWIETL